MDQDMHAHAERGDVPSLDEAISLPEADEKQHAVSALPAPYADKVKLILEACRDRNLNALIELATSEGGLVNDEARHTACKTPVLSATFTVSSWLPSLHGDFDVFLSRVRQNQTQASTQTGNMASVFRAIIADMS
jgi:hypothetical protein